MDSQKTLTHQESSTAADELLSRREVYGLIAGLAFGWVVIFGGISAMYPLLPLLRAEFKLTGSETGVFTSLLTLPYLLMQIPGGMLADRLGAKRVLVAMLLLAGISLTASGLWPFGFLVFVTVMVLYRTGCSAYFPISFGTSAGMVPAKERGLAGALLTMGTAIGGAVGIGVAAPLCSLADGAWRFPFVIFGLFTLSLPLLFQALRWPRQLPSRASLRGLAQVFRDRAVVLLLAVNFATNYASHVVFVWGPSFLATERGLSAAEAGFYVAMVNIIGFPAGLLSGIISDRFGRRYLTTFLLLAAGISVATLGGLERPLLALSGIVGYGLFGKWTADAPLAAWLGDRSAEKYPAMANAIFGVANTARMTGGLLSPLITGILLDATGTLSSGLILAGTVLCAAALLVLFIPRRQGARETA